MVETATEKLVRYKSPGTEILAELIQAEGNTLHSEIHELIHSIWNKEKLPQKWIKSVTVHIYKRDDKTDCIN
jgi:hypothetical protein